ncbi:MAG: NF038122 family metalloprotease, partial [Betaproteobacteria bacterium]|nr:NF038122 family metalloprotease [Betaproteobacteria bacterium]
MQINLSWDSSVASAPTGFQTAVQQAATILGAAILNPQAVTIQVGWNEVGGTAMAAGAYGEGGPSSSVLMDYYTGQAATNNAQVMAKLAGELNLNGQAALAASLPSSSAFGGSELALSAAQAKAFGVPNLYPATYDGMVGFSTVSAGNIDPANGSPWMVSLALHELSHALGRANGWVSGGTTTYTTMDAYTYSSPGVLWQPSSTSSGTTSGGYFSLDGGKTSLAAFESADPADFTGISDSFAGATGSTSLSAIDWQVVQSLGFATASNTNAMTPGATAHAAANTVFTGTGSDTVAYTGSSSQYTITATPNNGIVVQDTQPLRDGVSSLQGVGRLQFTDTSLAFDMGATQSGGHTAEILGAAFGSSSLTNKPIVGIGLKLFDAGYTMQQVAQAAINTGLVAGGSATPSNTAFVEAVWQNVVGSPIDSSSLTNLTNDLANGTFTQASLLAAAAELTINQAHIDLVGL